MTHAHFQKAVVQEVQDDAFIVQLPNGDLVTWPRSAEYMSDLQEGDEVVCTLTRTENVINDLLESDVRK